MIHKLIKLFYKNKINGYNIPKNDEYFNEYIHKSKDRLKFISDFTGSAGFAIILKNQNYLFVDGRYTIQAKGNPVKISKLLLFQINSQKIYSNLKKSLFWVMIQNYILKIN